MCNYNSAFCPYFQNFDNCNLEIIGFQLQKYCQTYCQLQRHVPLYQTSVCSSIEKNLKLCMVLQYVNIHIHIYSLPFGKVKSHRIANSPWITNNAYQTEW